MKKKYLKKMLAIMLAAMTVSATPGLVGAMNKESKEAIQKVNSKIESHKLTKEEATNMLGELEKMAEEDDEAKKEVSWTLGEMIHEGLFGKTSHYNDYMSDFDANMCSPETLSKIIGIFKTCSTADTAKRNTAWAIRIMAREGLLGRARSRYSYLLIPQCSSENLSDVIDILDECLKYKDDSVKEADYFKTKHHVAISVYTMAIRGVLGTSSLSLRNIFLNTVINEEHPFRNCPPKQTSKIMGFLEKCLKGNEEIVAKSIDFLASHILLNRYSKGKILNMLQGCFKNPNAEKSGIHALRVCAEYNLLKKKSVGKILDILEKCLQNDETAEDVAYTVCFMARRNMFGGDSLNRILNILCSCSNKFDINIHNDFLAISRAITGMAEDGVINAQTIDESLIKIFENGSKNHYAHEHTSEAIKDIAQKNLLNQCSPDKLKRIIDSLLSCREHNTSSQENVSKAVQAMANQGILNKCEPEQIKEIAGALADCLQGGSLAKREIINAITSMNNKDLLNQCDSAQIHQLVNALIGPLESGYTRNESADAILAMNEKGLLNKCEPEQIRQIFGDLTRFLENNNTREKATTIISAIVRNNNVLLGHLTSVELRRLVNSLINNLENNNTREATTIIISAMAENPTTFDQVNPHQLRQILNLFKTHLENYPADGNYELVDRIFQVFRRCSEIDALKADVADIIKMLTTDEFLSGYLGQEIAKPRLRNLIDTLHSCSNTQNDETKEKVTFIIAWVMREFSLRKLPSRYLPDQISQRVSEIIDILRECSRADIDKVYIASSIKFLAKEGFFNFLRHNQSSNLIDTLDNCLTYKGARIRDNMQNNEINDAQADVLSETNVAIKQLWESTFRAGLLPGEQPSRFDQISQECQELASQLKLII